MSETIIIAGMVKGLNNANRGSLSLIIVMCISKVLYYYRFVLMYPKEGKTRKPANLIMWEDSG